MKKLLACLSLLIFMFSTMAYGASQTEKGGFNADTNTTYEYGGIVYQIPSYYGDFTTEGNAEVTYAKNNGVSEAKISFLNYNPGIDFSDSDSIQSAKKAILETLNGLEDYDLSLTADTLVAGEPALIACGSNNKNDCLDWMVVVFNTKTSEAHLVEFLEDPAARYSYKTDYLTTILTAIHPGDPPATVSGKADADDGNDTEGSDDADGDDSFKDQMDSLGGFKSK